MSCNTLVDYLWCEHPEYNETWWEKSWSSSLEAEVAISLSRRLFSVKPARQYLKMVTSDIAILLLDVLLRVKFLASGFSELEWESSTSSRLLDLPTAFVTKAFSTWFSIKLSKNNTFPYIDIILENVF